MTEEADIPKQGTGIGAATLNSLKSSISRMIVGYGTLIAAVVGSVLYYVSYVAETTYLASFGLSPSVFGNGRPDVISIIIPAILFGTLVVTGLYQGVAGEKDPPRWIQRAVERSLSGDPKKAVYRVSFWTVIITLLISFAMVHFMAKQHGQMKATIARYRFDNLACSTGCVAYHFKSSKKPVRGFGTVDLLGIPIQQGNGLFGVYNGSGVSLVKVDDVGIVAAAKLQNGIQRNRLWAYDIISASGLY